MLLLAKIKSKTKWKSVNLKKAKILIKELNKKYK